MAARFENHYFDYNSKQCYQELAKIGTQLKSRQFEDGFRVAKEISRRIFFRIAKRTSHDNCLPIYNDNGAVRCAELDTKGAGTIPGCLRGKGSLSWMPKVLETHVTDHQRTSTII